MSNNITNDDSLRVVAYRDRIIQQTLRAEEEIVELRLKFTKELDKVEQQLAEAKAENEKLSEILAELRAKEPNAQTQESDAD